MRSPQTTDERVGMWWEAYDRIRRDITPDRLRVILSEMEMVEGVAGLESYMSMARNVMANDRAAAITAAMLVSTGAKPTPIETDEVA